MDKLPPFLIRLIGTKGFRFSEGNLYLMDVKGMFYPLPLIALMQKALEENMSVDKTHSMFCELGEIQAYMGTNQLIKRFGFKNKNEILTASFQQAYMIGAGKNEVIKADLDAPHLIIKNEHSAFAMEYKQKFGPQTFPVDAFLKGCALGTIKAIIPKAKNLYSVETQCVAMNKPSCIFEVMPINKFDKSNPIIKKQIQQKNFIGNDLKKKFDELKEFIEIK